ncbi:MAG: FliM/FliN family flagellar motor switch protein [Proteobacteria bacterium]|nr:FliM/FliN family flagellar motor switch protein [Pseudomonadota bacterium]
MSEFDENMTTAVDSEMTATDLPDPEVVNVEMPGSGLADEPVQTMSLATLNNISESKAVAAPLRSSRLPFEVMLDVPFTLVFEVGRTQITIKQLMELREGSFIELRNISVDSIDVRINDKIIAHAEAISLQQRYGIRFGEVVAFSGVEVESEIAERIIV